MSSPEEILLTTRRFSVVQVHVPDRDGVARRRQFVRHPGAVAILPLLDATDEVCLIRNDRIAIGRTLWEIPAGTLEVGEPPILCAERELREETGYLAESFQLLCEFFVSPGVMNEKIYVFVAKGLTPGPTALEPGEEIETCTMPWADAMRMAVSGQIEDAKTLLALHTWDRRRG